MKKIFQKNSFIINVNIILFFIYVISFGIIVGFFNKNEFISDLKHFILLFNTIIALFTYIKFRDKENKNNINGKDVIYIIVTGAIFILVSIIRASSVGMLFSFRSLVQTSLFVLPLFYIFLLVNIFNKNTIISILKITTVIIIILYFTEHNHPITSFFNIKNWLSIDIFNSHSFTESNIGAEPFLHLFLFFYYLYKYTDEKSKSIAIFMLISLVFAILSFKRLSLLFIVLLISFGFVIKYNKNSKIKVSFILSLVFVGLTYLYVKILMGHIDLGIDLIKLTSYRSWFMSLWKIKNYFSYGYGTSLFVIGRYLEMDLVQIYMELGILSLFIFNYSMFKLAGKRIYTIIIMLYVMSNLLTSSTMPYQLGWIMLGFNMYLLSCDYFKQKFNNKGNREYEEKISIIVPVYNVELYLKDCVDGLINQTYKNIEIILVDDGATDKSGEICDELSKKDSRIIVLHKKNGGLSDARNYGLDRAHGEYIIFVDSDDLVSEEMVEVLYNSLANNNADISIIDPTHFYNDEKPEYNLSNEIEIYNSEKSICEMLYQNKFLVSAWGKIYKKEIIKNNKFPVGMIFEDIAVMYKILDKCNVVVYNKSKLYGYRHRDDSITTKNFSKKDLDILKICDEMDGYFKNSNKKVRKAVDSYILNANFRVYLNSSGNSEYDSVRKRCYEYIKRNSLKCLLNKNVRNKLKFAILLFNFNQRLMMKVYKKVDRWK